jgi:hypothetical protein
MGYLSANSLGTGPCTRVGGIPSSGSHRPNASKDLRPIIRLSFMPFVLRKRQN